MKNFVKSVLFFGNIFMAIVSLMVESYSSFFAGAIWFSFLGVLTFVNYIIWTNSSKENRNKYAFTEYFKNLTKEY